MRFTHLTVPDEIPQNNYLANDFLDMMNQWHSYTEIWDDSLDAEILRQKLEIITTNRKRLPWGEKGTKYFTPSSANRCARELYLRHTHAPQDQHDKPAHQGRWQRLGTAFSDQLQTDLLYIQKHYQREFGESPAFVPEFVEVHGKFYPAWERFAQKIVWMEHRGHRIPILGQPDGILHHTVSGKRVGLEIKTKQTTASQTSLYTMNAPKEDHVKQCIVYALMYGMDDYLLVYGNLSKKAWHMSVQEREQTPDFRAFHLSITDEDRNQMLDYYADVLQAIDQGKPPTLDLDKWTFNAYKTACAHSLSEEEWQQVQDQVKRVLRSGLPAWKKEQYASALAFIREVRHEKTISRT